MIRTVISLEPEEKAWIDQLASKEHVSMATVIRKAIQHYRDDVEAAQRPTFKELLKKTKGISELGDGLQYQMDIRSEWDK